MLHQQAFRAIAVALALGGLSTMHAEETPLSDADGTVRVPAFTIPFSSLASPEAKVAFEQLLKRTQQMSNASDISKLDIVAGRKFSEEWIGSYATASRALYPVTIVPKT